MPSDDLLLLYHGKWAMLVIVTFYVVEIIAAVNSSLTSLPLFP